MSYEAPFHVRIGDFDRYGRLLPSSVLDIMQEVATIQADDMGIGRDVMVSKGVFWAVVRMKFEMLLQPGLHSVLMAKTWPHSPTKASFMRDYTLATSEGQLVARATSEWVLVDIEKRRFASVLNYYDGPTNFIEERALEGKLKKIPDFDEKGASFARIVPSYSDVDLNGHVNNSKYPNYVLDALRPRQDGTLRAMQIDYRHEILPEEELRVYALDSDQTVLAKGVNAEDKVMFAARIEYE
ncbi:MAG: hypothetical protein IJ131_10345 [Eggerthellaceae bacterium]|nr:hypothetical protein [Eggerthellaceae bacterium]